MDGTEARVNFDAPAVLRKWPSLHNERRTECTGPYLLVDGTLDECIQELTAKPLSALPRHLFLTARRKTLQPFPCRRNGKSNDRDCGRTNQQSKDT